jgi:hypothetical protein
MKCQRCLIGEAAYRAHTDAAEARRLGIAVEVLVGCEGKARGRRVSPNPMVTDQNFCLIVVSESDNTSLL